MGIQIVLLKSSKGIRAPKAVSVFRRGDSYSIPALSASQIEGLLRYDANAYYENTVKVRMGTKKTIIKDYLSKEEHIALALCSGCSGTKVIRGRVLGPPFLIVPWGSVKEFEKDLVLFDFYYFCNGKVERYAIMISHFVDIIDEYLS